MLPARPSRVVTRWFDGWGRRAMRRHFHGVHLYLEDAAEYDAADPARPRLYVANHGSFWDGIVLNALLRRRFAPRGATQPLYAMIDARQVAEHPFFRRVGGFSVDRGDARDGLRAVGHAADLLDAGAAVVVFPQGGIAPVGRRPLGFEPGIGRIAERCGRAAVVPVALRYEFWHEQRAEAMVRVGRERAGEGASRREVVRLAEADVTAGLDALEAAGRDFRPGDRAILRGRRSISRWKEAFRK